MPAPTGSGHPSTSMMAISLEETVKTTMYQKYIDADKALQQITYEARITDRVTQSKGVVHSWPVFMSAVLAEYRLIRPKLLYLKKITKDESKQKEFEQLKKDLDNLSETSSDNWQLLVKAHYLIGEFLELDGVTKFEREVPDLSTIMVQ